MAETVPAAIEELFEVHGKTWLADTAVQEKDSLQEETQETPQERK